MPEYSERYLWEVPEEDKDGAGVLLSDRIAFYVDAVKLIEHFDESCLRPASYDLSVGESYYLENIPEKVGPNGEISIPPNGLIYIKIKERFNLPYYMIGKYSLRVTQVYRGLLIDNGLQLDPGYHGYIHAVVHNLTNQPRIVHRGEKFLSLEFMRTAPFLPQDLRGVKTEKDLIARMYDLRGLGGKRLVLFPKKPDEYGVSREPPDFWLPGERSISSTLEMRMEITAIQKAQARLAESLNQRAGELEAGIGEARRELMKSVDDRTSTLEGNIAAESQRLSTFRNVSVGAVLVLVFTILYWFSDRYSEVQSKAADALALASRSAAVTDAERNIRELDSTVKGLQEQLGDLEKRVPQGRKRVPEPQ